MRNIVELRLGTIKEIHEKKTLLTLLLRSILYLNLAKTALIYGTVHRNYYNGVLFVFLYDISLLYQ